MSDLPDGIRRVFRLPTRPHIDEDVSDEVAFHLEMHTAHLVSRGMSQQDARAEALRKFGDTSQWSQAMRDVDKQRITLERRAEWLDDLRQDIRFAFRSLSRAPLFTTLAVLTLALGIGANAAVFGVVKSVLLDGLPYTDADRVVQVYGRRLDGTNDRLPVSAGTIADLRARATSFASLSSFLGQPEEAVYADAEPQLIKLIRVEPSFFGTLGVAPAIGRTLRDSDAAADTAFNVILTHSAWQRLLGGDSAAAGRTVRINGITRTVVGILPRDFVGPLGDVDFYLPYSLEPMMRTVMNARMRKNNFAVARLKPDVTVETASREVAAIAAEGAREFPRESANSGAYVKTVRDALAGDTRTPLLVLMGSAALVLLITCANLAGALLSRTISRRKEFAVRAALGAGSGRLVRQLLTESTLLAVAGGVTGVLLAVAGLRLLRGFAAQALPEYASLTLDPVALLVTGALAVITGLAFGVAPALSVSRSNPQGALREETRGASESRRSRQLRGALVAGQIALSVSLLAGAALLARSLSQLTSSPLGFNPDRVLASSVYLPRQRYPRGEDRTRFFDQFEARLRALPGVVSVASAGQVPPEVTGRNGFIVVGAPPIAENAQPMALYMNVSDDYFSTMSIPVLSGRAFSAEDRADAPQSLIVNESMVRRYWPNGNAIGSSVRLDPNPESPAFTVVGVVGDVRSDPASPDAEPVLYTSMRQAPFNGPIFLVRTQGDPTALVSSVRRELAVLDPALPMYDVAALSDLVSDQFAGRRLPAVLMTAFGALALVLASVGVYAMFGAMAAAREREFAVRVALGSSRGAIAGLVLRQGGMWMAVGLAAGVLGVFGVTRALRTLLYGVDPFDPVSFTVAALLLVACGGIALLVPVRKATQADPISVLR
ncbi:MAG: ABC transporter permease [Gemmatimonadota bacterium]